MFRSYVFEILHAGRYFRLPSYIIDDSAKHTILDWILFILKIWKTLLCHFPTFGAAARNSEDVLISDPLHVTVTTPLFLMLLGFPVYLEFCFMTLLCLSLSLLSSIVLGTLLALSI